MKRWLDNPHHLRLVHLVLAVWFMFPVFPATVWVVFNLDQKYGMVLLQFFSLYALTATHWGAWQAARGEEAAKGG